MIPFSRVLVYGNTATSKIEIKKMRCSHDSWLALSTKGDLYGRGTGALGDGLSVGSFRADWILIRSGVVDFWTNSNHQILYIKTDDNKLYWCGAKRYRSASTDLTYTTTFAEESSNITSLNFKRFLFNDSNSSILALTTTNTCFLIGMQRAFTGSSGSLSSWTLMASGVTEVLTTGTNYFTVATNGTVYGGGQNIANILNPTASSGDFFAWPISIGSMRTTNPGITNGQYSVKFISTLGEMVGRGFGNNGFFGNGSTADLKNTTTISAGWPDYSKMIRQSDQPPASSVNKSYYYTSSKLYFMGIPSRSGSTSTSTVLSPQQLVVPFTPSDIIYIQVGQNNTVIYTSSGKIYYAGMYFSSGTTYEDSVEFTEYDSSLFSKFKINITRNSML